MCLSVFLDLKPHLLCLTAHVRLDSDLPQPGDTMTLPTPTPRWCSSMTLREGYKHDPSLKGAQIWTIWEMGPGRWAFMGWEQGSEHFLNVSKQLNSVYSSKRFIPFISSIMAVLGKDVRVCVSVFLFHQPLPWCQQCQSETCVCLLNRAFRVFSVQTLQHASTPWHR